MQRGSVINFRERQIVEMCAVVRFGCFRLIKFNAPLQPEYRHFKNKHVVHLTQQEYDPVVADRE